MPVHGGERRRERDLKHLRETRIACPAGPASRLDCSYEVLRKKADAVQSTRARSASVAGPVLACHVGCVVGRGPQKQVSRVDAGPTIALVAHEHPVRNRTNGKFVGKSVCQLSVPLSVPINSYAAGEKPAAFVILRLLHESPEARLWIAERLVDDVHQP